MKKRKYRYFMGDFETTVYKGQTDTEVWASACVELFTEDVHIFHSIGEQFDYFTSLNENLVVYYHNLKFDGAFWLSYLLVDLGYKQALEQIGDNPDNVAWLAEKDMLNNTFKYSISDKGMWYTICIKVGGHFIEFRDSLKLLPFSVNRIGESFGTKHKKLDIEYKGLRYAGCEITEEEQSYIKNDVLVVKEALEIMHNEGHNKLTIGSCCLAEFKRLIGRGNYHKLFPNIYEIKIDKELYGEENAGEYVRHAYRGGWCYVVKGKERQIKHNGITADVNSLYPSMMSSESHNKYPVGEPTFWKGNYIPDEALAYYNYYFVRIRTRFYIKKNYLPFIQIKNSLMYKATECLETSDILYKKDGKYYSEYINFDGIVEQAYVTMTLTMTDYELIKEHYELVDFEILDGCYFRATVGIFDCYIDKYKKIKLESTGAVRELAKLFLNNLYGKMASNTNSTFKVAVPIDGIIKYMEVVQYDKEPGYIPVGSAITSYARNFTIRAAQKNYYGVDERGFIYADTDSCHMDLSPDEIKGIKVDDKNFCCWKLEATWDDAIFVRQKTYIEHVIAENLKPIDKPYYNIKCAGMPDRCKKQFIKSLEGDTSGIEGMPIEEQEFIKKKRTLKDFDIGLTLTGKLLPKRIKGGIVLEDTTYIMR